MCRLCCISPVLVARVLSGCEVTIGSDTNTAAIIQEMGSKHVNKTVFVYFLLVVLFFQ